MPNRVLRDWTFSEKVNELSDGAEVLFTRLIMKADDYGTFHANTKILKAQLYPLRDISLKDISEYLREIHLAELVVIYESKGKEYLQIVDFNQRLRRMTPKYPLPDEDCIITVALVNIDTQENDVQALAKCQSTDGLKLEPETETETETETRDEKRPLTPKGESLNFNNLLCLFNEIFNKKSRMIPEKVKSSYRARVKEGYSLDDIEKAMRSAALSEYHTETAHNHCTLEFFSRADKLDKYINFNNSLKTVKNGTTATEREQQASQARYERLSRQILPESNSDT